MTTLDTITKFCKGCKKDVEITHFHLRSSFIGKIETPTESRHVISECKTCMRERGKTPNRLSPHESREATEGLFVEYLAKRGFPALPGKALKYSWVDVVILGHIWAEVKYSNYTYEAGAKRFKFGFSARQRETGPKGHIVVLICDWGDKQSFHLFPWNYEAFYHGDGRRKTGIDFVPGKEVATRHKTRNIMTQSMMDQAENRTKLIWDYINRVHDALLRGERPTYGEPFAR